MDELCKEVVCASLSYFTSIFFCEHTGFSGSSQFSKQPRNKLQAGFACSVIRLLMKLSSLRTQESVIVFALYLGCLFSIMLNSCLMQAQFLLQYSTEKSKYQQHKHFPSSITKKQTVVFGKYVLNGRMGRFHKRLNHMLFDDILKAN